MQKQDISYEQSSSQTQQFPSSSYIPKSTQSSHILTLPKQFYFQQFALYCSRRGKDSQLTDYQSNQLPIATITTLQQFFDYFLSIKKPSQLQVNSKVMWFHKNCQPFWEEWLDSGCLLIKFRENKPQEERLLDAIWQFLCYSLVGSNIDQDAIGVSMCKREKMTLVEIWLRNNDRAEEIGVSLQEKIKKELPPQLLPSINSIMRIKYKRHVDSMNKNSTIKGAQNLKTRHKIQMNNSI